MERSAPWNGAYSCRIGWAPSGAAGDDGRAGDGAGRCRRQSPMPRVVSVVVPVPALDRLDYEVPPELPAPETGTRVLVPLGTRAMTGCVVDRPESPPPAGLKPLLDVLDAEPLLPAGVVGLALWVGEYYACGAGEAVAAAMPRLAWVFSERRAEITPAGRAALAGRPGAARGRLLELLSDGAPHRVAALDHAGGRRGPGQTRSGRHALLAAMARDGLVRLTQPLKGAASAFKTVRVARLTAAGRERLAAGVRLGRRQREALERLGAAAGELAVPVLTAAGVPAGTLSRLAELGAVTIASEVVAREPGAVALPDAPEPPAHTLTPRQRQVVEALEGAAGSGDFEVALLHGVTGSGKTEVYARLARAAVARGRQALVLVPEIALTPAIAARLRPAFGARVAVQHSGLSDGARHDQWHRIRRGEIDVVVGTRSAVFAPLPSVGLIVVDEEHDASYKQDESPRYHGRDVAIMRGKRDGALVLLGSATPSLESFRHAGSGRYRRFTLPQRIGSRPLPDVRIVDMRDELAAHGPEVVLSAPLAEGIDRRLADREQALVLLNRRGFAASLLCRGCGHTLECPDCSVSLTFHRAAGRARCHYCGYSRARPAACPRCSGAVLEHVGVGTERVQAEIERRWPAARVARLDRDTVRRRGAAARLLQRVARRELDILVGTQMVAKGHDFPGVTLVGVVSADIGLGVPDFRAGERTFQLLTQVAGRAGRGSAPGEAIVQTLHPGHYAIRHACDQAYAPFYQEELRFRRALRYPPVVSLVSAVVHGTLRDRTLQEASALAARLRAAPRRFTVLGPAPAPLARLRGRYRVQLFLKGGGRAEMREALLRILDEHPRLKRSVIVDVDPVSML